MPRPGLAALDPVTGRPFTWNPGRKPLGVAVFAVLATADGPVDRLEHRLHRQLQVPAAEARLLPLRGWPDRRRRPATARLPGTVYLGGSKAPAATNVLYRVDAGGPAIQSLDSGPDWAADTSDPSPYRNSGSNAAG